MKVLLYRYGSICEPDIIEAFNELGIEVIEEHSEVYNKDLSMQEQIKLVSNRLILHPVDFVFSINFYPTLSEVCNIHHIPYLSWTVDSPVLELYTKSITNPYNRTFIFDYEDYAELEPLNPGHIFHLPLAASVRLKDKANDEASASARKRFAHDVAFVGSLYTEKNPFSRLKNAPAYLTGYLDGILESQLKVYGVNFMEQALTDEIVEIFKENFEGFYQLPGENYLTDRMTFARLYLGANITALERDLQMRALSENFDTSVYTGSDTSMYPKLHNRGFAKTLTEMPVIFRQSKINLSTTSRSIRSGISLRIWDILGSGGFCLTNFQSELGNYFDDGVHLASYGSLEELVEKCDYYLSHESERAEIAHEGYEYVKNHHTFTIRVAQMIQLAFADMLGDSKSSEESIAVSVENDNDNLPILIYLPGDMCYGVLERFAKLLGGAFERHGENVIYFDTTGDNFTKVGDFIGKKFKYIFGFQSFMFSIKTVGGDYVHDLIEGEKFNFYFDHPIKGREHLGDCCRSVNVLTLDTNYVWFIEKHYGLKSRFLPPAGEQIEGELPAWEDRQYPVSFLGSYGAGFHGYLSELMSKPRETRILYNHLFRIVRANPNMPSEIAFAKAMTEVFGEFTEEEYMEAFAKAATMLRLISHHYREQVIRKILDAGIELHVFGDSWKYSPFVNYPNLVIHPEVREDEAAGVYANSKISINIMSWHKGGFTERMESAMLNGSLLFTDRSDYTDEHFTDGQEMSIFKLDDLDEMIAKLQSLITDDDKAKSIADRGFKVACDKLYTWDGFVSRF